ncbi:MAG TPA: outer membrane beta-barrel protein [Alphaproteobacteria bacterium]|nr:outer membrane beta-barrel protein [Alphaproteobacteria bacterium]
MGVSRAIAAATGLLLALAAGARAEEPGPYLGLGAGPSWLASAPLRRGSASSNITFDSDGTAIGSVGLALDRSWRAEVEIGSRRDNAQGLTAAGDLTHWNRVSNLTFNVETGSGWTPYFGAGIGTLRYHASGLRMSANGAGDDDTLAYQGIVGVSYAFTPTSRFFFDYRYVRSDDPGARDPAGNTVRTEQRSSTVLFGFRFTLSQPESR